MKNEWISVEEELPPENGQYMVTNQPEYENDPTKCFLFTVATYDGIGFDFLGVYRPVKYWKYTKRLQKKYGRLTEV